MDLVSGPVELLYPKNIALIMFNHRPEKFFPYSRIKIVKFPNGLSDPTFYEKPAITGPPIKYYAYLYLLSFNWPNDIRTIQFMRIAFYPLHRAASEGRLDYELWRNISPYTEELSIWLDWDRCKKLRKAVVKRIKNSGLNKDFIENLTPDKELSQELVKIWEK